MSKSCPYCKSKQRNRVQRPVSLKHLPFTAMYSCMKCGGKYVFNTLIYKCFKFKLPPIRKII